MFFIMKKIFVTGIFLLFTLFVFSQNSGALLALKPDTVKLGEIALNELDQSNGKVQIVVFNEGNKPLILNEVSGCCGTNIMEWPKAPILPGKSGIIKVEFRIEPKPQLISRTVTIKSNSSKQTVVKVPIVGLVYQPKSKDEITL